MIMKQPHEKRQICYDHTLQIEAYQLKGIVQKFPNHFHECYVIGYVERGSRHLKCNQQEYALEKGDLVLFNPLDKHFCEPVNGEDLDYRAINIPADVMIKAARDITGAPYTPHFTSTVVRQSDAAQSVNSLYTAVTEHQTSFEKEEAFFFLLEQIIKEHLRNPLRMPMSPRLIPGSYKSAGLWRTPMSRKSVWMTSAFAGLSKSYLLRSFTRQMGISPYRYLQTVRINQAKKLLETGTPVIDTAAKPVFQTKVTSPTFFRNFIGLTPKQYQRIFYSGGIP